MKVFVDTSAWAAYYDPSDRWHAAARDAILRSVHALSALAHVPGLTAPPRALRPITVAVANRVRGIWLGPQRRLLAGHRDEADHRRGPGEESHEIHGITAGSLLRCHCQPPRWTNGGAGRSPRADEKFSSPRARLTAMPRSTAGRGANGPR